jgi:hypothetical protein
MEESIVDLESDVEGRDITTFRTKVFYLMDKEGSFFKRKMLKGL